MVGVTRAAPQEFAEIGTEGVRQPVPFEEAAKTVVIHIPRALRASRIFGHGYLPTLLHTSSDVRQIPRRSLRLPFALHQSQGRNLLRTVAKVTPWAQQETPFQTVGDINGDTLALREAHDPGALEHRGVHEDICLSDPGG